VSENKRVYRTQAASLVNIFKGLESVSDEPEEKKKEEEIVKETEPETQTIQLLGAEHKMRKTVKHQ
jgi:hypothetical protein